MTLIPKVENPESLSWYRLYNVFYKAISKCLTNRPKTVMLSLVSPLHNVFVSDRVIGDGRLLVDEILHFLKKERHKHPVAAIKVDLNKA